MNLRITPSVNTQNNRQNPNFGMIKCPDEAATKRLLEIAEMSTRVGLNKFVHPVEKRTLFHASLTDEQAAQLREFPDVFMTDGDLKEIVERSSKEGIFDVMLDMATHAKEVTMDAITAMAEKFGVPEKAALEKARIALDQSSTNCLAELGVDTRPLEIILSS